MGYLNKSACGVGYHFTLLDINSELRFCCRGDKKVESYTNILDQWKSKKYNQNRKEWFENYENNKSLCLGCPHHEENKKFGDQLAQYLAQHAD